MRALNWNTAPALAARWWLSVFFSIAGAIGTGPWIGQATAPGDDGVSEPLNP
jgi:hypothetical protein